MNFTDPLKQGADLTVDAPAPDNDLVNPGVDRRNNYDQPEFINHFSPVDVSNVGMPTQTGLGALTGVTIFEAGYQIGDGIRSGSWMNIASGAAAAALDVLGYLTDPLGYVAGQLFTWMLEHVEPLREVLDMLAGNPTMIKAYSDSWGRVEQELTAVGAEFATQIKGGTTDWIGESGDAYRARGADVGNMIAGVAAAANGVKNLITQVGELIAGIRTAVRDTLAGLAAQLVSSSIELAATVGTAAPHVIVKVLREISTAFTTVSKLVKSIADALEGVLIVMVALRDLMDGVAKACHAAENPT